MQEYEQLLEEIFRRFPSVQNVPFSQAYKPGLEGMRFFDEALGRPSGRFRSIHVAGTNGKGSVANMLASAMDACGYKTGLYTSPHILDFRERARIGGRLIPREYVYDFLLKWKPYFEEHSLSFFEITTGMAFKWFADEAVDVAVVEVGLGGRLDSTNIITPELSIVTTIGLDHCALLGNTLADIAAEKAGIFKPGVPALVGEATPETLPVFASHASSSPLYLAPDVPVPSSSLAPGSPVPSSSLTSDVPAPSRSKCFYREKSSKNTSPTPVGHPYRIRDCHPELDKTFSTFFGEKVLVHGGKGNPAFENLLQRMDLQAQVQRKNLATVLAAVELLKDAFPRLEDSPAVEEGIAHTAERMGFHGRWERLSETPLVIADIGHNAQALESNFAQIARLGRPVIIYGIMADKDLDAIIPLMPRTASWIFTTPKTARALPAEQILQRCQMPDSCVADSVASAVRHALDIAGSRPVYIGGSTFVVAEALPCFGKIFEH